VLDALGRPARIVLLGGTSEIGLAILAALRAPGETEVLLAGRDEQLLAAAGKDARARADNILKSTGGADIKKLISADMGIININPANSTHTSEEGNNDTSSLDKDIITIVHANYELD